MQWGSVFYPLPNYVYFEKPARFGAAPSVGKLNLLKTAWMADAAMLAYARSGQDRIPAAEFGKILEAAEFVKFDLLGDWSGGPKGTQGYFAKTTEFAVLAFRGTEKDDWKDLATNLATWPVAEDAGDGDRWTAARAVFDQKDPAVHAGFQAALNEVWEEASEKLARYREETENEIFFTGHSLGAALATLAISRSSGGNASLYTFGSPRVGNRAFAERLGSRAGLGQFRLVDRNDLVTRVPAALFWYAHSVGTLFQIDQGGAILDRTADAAVEADDAQELERDLNCLSELRFPIELDGVPPADLYDHSPGRYCNSVWNALL